MENSLIHSLHNAPKNKAAIVNPQLSVSSKENLEPSYLFSVYSADYSEFPFVFGVEPKDNTIPIQELEFHGFTFLKRGDIVYARVPKYNEQKGNQAGMYIEGKEKCETVYLERDHKPRERALEIQLLDETNHIFALFKENNVPQ